MATSTKDNIMDKSEAQMLKESPTTKIKDSDKTDLIEELKEVT